MRIPARRDWRLTAAADLGVLGSPNRPVSRRDARDMVSRMVHCLRLAMMKSTMLAMPNSATKMTTMMIAASPPLLMLNDPESDPDAPASVSTAPPAPAPGALYTPAGDVGVEAADDTVNVACTIDCAKGVGLICVAKMDGSNEVELAVDKAC